MASLDLGLLKISIGVDNQEANKQITQTGEVVKDTESKIGNAAKAIGSGIGIAAAAVGTASIAVAKGFWDMAQGTAESAGTILDASNRMGISAENFQELKYAAEQSGVSMGDMEAAAKKLAASGSDLTFDQAISQIAGIKDESERAAKAQELFGKGAYNLMPLINEGTSGIEALKKEARDYGMVMSNEAVAGGESFGDSMARLQGTLEGFKNQAMGAVLPAMDGIVSGLTGMLTGAEGAQEAFTAGVTSFVGSIQETATKFLGMAAQIIPVLIEAIVGSLPSLVETVLGIVLLLVETLIQQLPSILEAGVQILISIIDGITQALPTLIPTIIEVVLTMITTLIAQLPLIIKSGLELIVALVKGILDAIPVIIDALPEIIDTIITTLLDMIPMIIQCGIDLLVSLVKALPTIIRSIVTALPKIINSIIDGLFEYFPLLIECGIELFTSLITELPKIIVEIVKAIPEIIKSIVTAIVSNENLKKLAQTGLDLIKGIWNGISDAAKWLWDKVAGFCANLVDQIKGFFGIHSPSTVFAGFGENMVQGLANGLEDTAGLAVKAIGDMARDVEGAFNPSLSMPSVNASYNTSASAFNNQNKYPKTSGEGAQVKNVNLSPTYNFTSRELSPYEQQVQIKRLNKDLGGICLMERFVFKNAQGAQITIGYDGNYLIGAYEGLSASEIIPYTNRGYQQNGATFVGSNLGIRLINLQIGVIADSTNSMYERRRSLISIFNPLLGEGTLTYTNDYISKSINVTVTGAPSQASKISTIVYYNVELTANNPLWFDNEESALLMGGFTGGLTFPLELDGTTIFAEKGAVATININGDVPSPIRAVFKNYSVNPKLTLIKTGEFIQVDTTIEDEENLTITTAYGNKNVIKTFSEGEQASAFHLINLDSTFFNLPVGENKLAFTADLGAPEVYLYWRNYFVGV